MEGERVPVMNRSVRHKPDLNPKFVRKLHADGLRWDGMELGPGWLAAW